MDHSSGTSGESDTEIQTKPAPGLQSTEVKPLRRLSENRIQPNAIVGATINDAAAKEQPEFLSSSGINLISPVLERKLKTYNTTDRGSDDLLPTDPTELTAVEGPTDTHRLRPEDNSEHRGPRDCLLGKSNFVDENLGSKNAVKEVKPKSSPATSNWGGEQSSTREVFNERNADVAKTGSDDLAKTSNDPEPITDEERNFAPERRKITILSMDGGGMRGLIAARCLAHLESLLQAKTGGDVKLYEYFDFLAGTSTGAILVFMIATPDETGYPLFTGQGCCQFYARNGRKIFRPRWLGSLRQLCKPKYSPKRFEKVLKKYLVRNGKPLTMKDTMRPFLVTSFDISRSTPYIFLRKAAMKDDSRNYRLWEVCRGSASAPTYFRPADVTSVDGKFKATLIDGGSIQNNPALVAMMHVLGNNEDFPEAVGLQDLLILSLGAGQLDEKFDLRKAKKWGMASWVRPLVNIMMNGSSDTVDYQLAAGFAGHNCSENYLRIQLSGLPNKTSLMDCATKENIQDLVNFTDQLLEEKALTRNEYGEKVIHSETNFQRLSWFADQLIAQKKLRDEREVNDPNEPNTVQLVQNSREDQGRSPKLFGQCHLFIQKQFHDNETEKGI